MIQKNIGGNRLGSGDKLTTKLHGYERSTHDLGKVTRTTMTVGTLVPIYTEFVQKGDVWDIDLETLIRTHPTNGPVFGTYKLQLDVFTADVRLYNRRLHNNPVGIGNKMNEVIFPRMVLLGQNPKADQGELNQQQIAPDSLLAYLGIRGLGTNGTLETGKVGIERNAMPLMMYYEIYKEYYSNKQEEVGYVIVPDIKTGAGKITEAWVTDDKMPGSNMRIIPLKNNTTGNNIHNPTKVYSTDRVVFHGENLARQQIMLYINGQTKNDIKKIDSASLWQNVSISEDGTRITYERPLTEFNIYVNNIDGEDVIIIDETVAGTETQIGIEEFPLKNIDDMRDLVFEQPYTSPLKISYTTSEEVTVPYMMPYGATVNQYGSILGSGNQTDSNMAAYYTMSGLALKTHQSDRFQNWLNTEWIDAINDISSVTISGNSFTIDALNLAEKIYKLENRIAIAGNTYQDWLEVVYGEKIHGAAEMPVYRGGMSAEIAFDEVISSSDAMAGTGEDQPLGTLGGRGIQKMKKGGKIRFRAEEHGYVMILASITPRIDYYQGNKWWTKLETMDDIHKPQLDAIGFQELTTDEFVAWDTKIINGIENFYSIGKQPSWTHYMTNQNEVYGNFARENAEQFMVLARRYEYDENGRLADGTTYIDPTKYLYPFASVELKNQPFWVQVGTEAIVRRQMSANQMPNL